MVGSLQMNGQMDGLMNGWMDKWIGDYGQTDRLINEQMDE